MSSWEPQAKSDPVGLNANPFVGPIRVRTVVPSPTRHRRIVPSPELEASSSPSGAEEDILNLFSVPFESAHGPIGAMPYPLLRRIEDKVLSGEALFGAA